MNAEEIKALAKEAAHEAAKEVVTTAAKEAAHEATLGDQEIHTLVKQTVQQTLMQLGVNSENPIEMQKDFQHLREWRNSMQSIKQKGVLTLTAISISGIIAAFWIGFKELVGK